MLYFLFTETSREGSIYYAPQVNKNSSCVGLFSKKFPCDCRCHLSAWQRQLISILLSSQREVRWAKDTCGFHCFEQRPLQYWCEVCVRDKMYSKVVLRNPSLLCRVQQNAQRSHSTVNTNTCTTSLSLIKIYLKFLKNTPTCFGHSTIIREFFCLVPR